MKQNRKSKLFFIVSLIFCVSAKAQKLIVKGNLDAVTVSGFYSITVTPLLSSYTTINFSNLRIADETEQYQPYFISPKHASFPDHSYIKFVIIKNELADSGRSLIIIKNQEREKTRSVDLLIRNATVSRMAAISGSDDMNRWFTVAENILLEKQFVTGSDRYIQTINFPTSSYRFFKITIENGKNNPLNIIEAARYADTERRSVNTYYPNPLPAFFQRDSADHNSYITVHQSAAFHSDKIILKLNVPGFFKRNVDVMNREGIVSFQISSDSVFNFFLPPFNDQDWMIKIYNGDNKPLKVTSVSTGQELQKITTYLEQGKKYNLFIGDSTLQKPVYDLLQFKDSIPGEIRDLEIVSWEIVHSKNTKNNSFIPAKLLWPIIIAVLVILGFVTFRLTKEMKDRK